MKRNTGKGCFNDYLRKPKTRMERLVAGATHAASKELTALKLWREGIAAEKPRKPVKLKGTCPHCGMVGK